MKTPLDLKRTISTWLGAGHYNVCCQSVDLSIRKDCICKYIIILINNEKKHETYCFFLGLCVCNEDRRGMGWLCLEFEN